MKTHIPVRDEARPFEEHELFFSVTDTHGRIVSGNEVFVRISGFSVDELLGAPHSIIRHPHMPRAVFRLLWDRIQRNTPIAAIVKNRAHDGTYYWVVAYVSPIADGYLSVRFKPSAELVAAITGLYAEMRAVEEEIEGRPDGSKDEAIVASSDLLLSRLQSQGFESYDSFIEGALFNEYAQRYSRVAAARSLHLAEGSNSPAHRCVTKIVDALSALIGRHCDFTSMESNINSATECLSSLSLLVQRAALNIMIQTEQDGDGGTTPLSIVASWLRDGSVHLDEELQRLLLPIKGDIRKVQSGLYKIAASQLQIEMILFFLHEMKLCDETTRGYDDTQAAKMMLLLAQAADSTFRESLASIQHLEDALKTIGNAFVELQREILGLGLAYVNGKVECSKMPRADILGPILESVFGYINDAKTQLIGLERSFVTLDGVLSRFSTTKQGIGKRYDELAKCLASTKPINAPRTLD